MNTLRSKWFATYPRRIVILAAVALVLAVLWLLSPLGWETAALITVGIVGIALLFLRLGAERPPVGNSGEAGAIGADLRAALGTVSDEQLARMPVLLVVGDGLAATFDRLGESSVVQRAGGAIWLRVNHSADLPQLACAVSRWRGGVVPEGVVIAVSPGCHAHTDALEQMLYGVRQALADTSRLLGSTLPAYVAVYQRVSADASGGLPEWFGIATQGEDIETCRFAHVVEASERAAQCSCGSFSAAHRAAAMSSIVPWSARIIREALAGSDVPTRRARLQGFAWSDCGPATHWERPWERSAAAHTCVRVASTVATAQPWPLPIPFVEAIRPRRHLSVFSRVVLHMFTLLACGAALAFWTVGKNNESLIHRFQSHLDEYAAVESGHDVAKRDALHTLVRDRDQLDRYDRLGAPLRLSFGLYHGAQLMPPLGRAIASYVPPPAPPAVITLDSMSLFDTGKASLKPGSTRLMVNAVDMIRAHADKRVLVAGYTDNVGSAEFNLKLSKARAEAVRDWLAEASGIATTQFAIQGYGQTRPIASNDTDAGRTRNRRVEITLVPDSGT